LQLEHIAATRSLQELREIFEIMVQDYKEKARMQRWIPATDPIDVHFSLRNMSTLKFKEELYTE
jgi:hypothetical protein